jgi:hypothetical protein
MRRCSCVPFMRPNDRDTLVVFHFIDIESAEAGNDHPSGGVMADPRLRRNADIHWRPNKAPMRPP